LNRGFTLLEILIANLLLVAGTLAIVWALSTGIFATSDVENTDLALNLAGEKMEDVFGDLKNTDLTTLVLATYEAGKSETITDFNLDFDVMVDLTDQNPPNQDLLQIEVTVEWDTKGGTASVVLTTLVADV